MTLGRRRLPAPLRRARGVGHGRTRRSRIRDAVRAGHRAGRGLRHRPGGGRAGPAWVHRRRRRRRRVHARDRSGARLRRGVAARRPHRLRSRPVVRRRRDGRQRAALHTSQVPRRPSSPVAPATSQRTARSSPASSWTAATRSRTTTPTAARPGSSSPTATATWEGDEFSDAAGYAVSVHRPRTPDPAETEPRG